MTRGLELPSQRIRADNSSNQMRGKSIELHVSNKGFDLNASYLHVSYIHESSKFRNLQT